MNASCESYTWSVINLEAGGLYSKMGMAIPQGALQTGFIIHGILCCSQGPQ